MRFQQMHPTGSRLREVGALWRLAFPIAMVQLGQAAMGFVDIAVVGRLGTAPLASVGLGNALFFSIAMLGLGFLCGIDPVIAQAFGAGDALSARKGLWQGIWMAGAASVVLASLMALAPLALPLFGISASLSKDAAIFLHWRLLGLLPLLAFGACRSYLQAARTPGPLVWAALIANGVNFGLDLLFVFGTTSLPAMGARGAALASTLSTIVQLAIAGTAIAWRREHFSEPVRGLHRKELRSAVRVGIPIGLHLFSEVGVFALAGILAGRLGALSLAAHQVALGYASLSFAVALGVGNAGSVSVGWAVGRGDTPAARRAGLLAIGSGAVFMGLCAVLLLAAPRALASLMTTQADVAELAASLLMVAGVFQIFDGIQGVGAGVLRGAGDSRFTFLANLMGHFVFGLPLALGLAFGGGWGVIGIWWGLSAGLLAVAIALLARFLRLSAKPIAALHSLPTA